MQKTILITGATDGIGLETAKKLVKLDHHVLLHGRSPSKLAELQAQLEAVKAKGRLASYVADFSTLASVSTMAESVIDGNESLDVLINNAGVFKVSDTNTSEGLDVRFAVNAIAPYALTKCLMPLFDSSSRVVNLSSAAQASVDIDALLGVKTGLDDMEAYAQSKLAITMWSRHMAKNRVLEYGLDGPVVIAVNPGSLLGSKMVREAFGVEGADLTIGADILCRAALSDEFVDASGKYYDNDSKQFAAPHPDALDDTLSSEVVRVIESILKDKAA